jgi:hypothetical protein
MGLKKLRTRSLDTLILTGFPLPFTLIGFSPDSPQQKKASILSALNSTGIWARMCGI